MDPHPETTRRLKRFRQIADNEGRVVGVPPSDLNDSVDGLRVFYGGRGIWRDLARTKSIAESGVTVGLLHTGRHYADDLLADGIVYHYPTTASSGTDAGEIEATKNARRLGIPVFVVIQRDQLRDVHLGLIEDFNDGDKSFLVGFTSPDEVTLRGPPTPGASPDEEPFIAFDKKPKRLSEVNARERDPRFAFKVKKRSGSACAVCRLDVKGLIDAAHVIPVKEGGSDHPANGLPLCPTHHRAFDSGLFWIEPETLEVHTASAETTASLRITVHHLGWLPACPDAEAITWHTENIARR